MTTPLEHLKQLLGEVEDLKYTAALLNWDHQVYMPPGGALPRAMQLATISRIAHEKFVSDEMSQAIEAAKQAVGDLNADTDDARMVKKAEHDYLKEVKVPSEWVAEFSRITALAHGEWEKAREATDFSIFEPHAQQIVELRQQYADFFKPYDHPYDPLLDDYEPGMKSAQVREVFDTIKPVQIELVRAIVEEGEPVDDAVVHLHYDVDKQWDFGMQVIKDIGYDFNNGRQDKSTHPFTTSFGITDVRITTRFDPNFLNTAIFSSLHEAGHGMYEQGVRTELDRTPLAGGTSLGVHESQSRMWENLVGRSKPFWRAYFPKLKEYFPQQIGDINLEDFYRAINKVERSFIRVEADEATYNLHIMLRFDLEMAMMEGDLAVKDLPEAWNEKFKHFFGVLPPDDAKGVLQDVHWSSGLVGYFPTYALGNLIASQLWEKIQKDLPDLQSKIEQAEFDELLGWLHKNIHQHGSKYEPMELLQRVTGSGLEAGSYIHYLESKFKDIYNL
ncbi:MAG: carboxypeptidase M32 [Anaerolineales bacterium]|jgi:carboxypeptidase Taq